MPSRRAASPTESVSVVPLSEQVPDADLVHRFVCRKDEAAFATLLERHGPMVLGVCRRVLPDGHEAEDAFQATFLIFLQKARSLRDPASVGNWLYGVAYRVARRARAVAARWRSSERQVSEMIAPDPSLNPLWHELRPILDEEVARLPAKYQAPVVLCYLEGKTYSEAASILGWAEGTVSGRLARARDRLRSRLALRGLALSGVLLPVLLSQKGTEIVPSALSASIQKGATALLTGQAAAAAFTSTVAILARATRRALVISKLKVVMVLLAAACVLCGGTMIVARRFSTDKRTFLLPSFSELQNKFHRHLEKLQGTWDLVSLEKGARPASAEELDKLRLVWIIEGDQIVMQSNDGKSTATYSLVPSRNPKTIDLTIAADAGKQEQTLRGIYARTNATLRVCYDPKGTLEPKRFETAPGRTVVLMVFKKRA